MKHLIISILMLTTVLTACDSSKKTTQTKTQEKTTMADNSKNSLDWIGVYLGTLPCADCEGIQTQIRLNEDASYEIATKYTDKNDNVFRSVGHFTWNEAGNKITLEKTDSPVITAGHYLVGENMLIALDQNGERIQSALPPETYFLKKIQPNTELTEKYWKLIELHGKKFVLVEKREEPHFILKTEGNKIIGNGGCNSFTGEYELSEGNRIRFSKMVSTMMACMDVDYESEFLKMFGNADNYSIKEDTLSLNKARMAHMAKFVAVYLK